MRKGFTLLELIVVIIIIGILATLGFTQYTRMIERSRGAEARQVLGSLRTQLAALYIQGGSILPVANVTNAAVGVGTVAGQISNSCAAATDRGKYFFQYMVSSSAANTFTATGTRCTAGGKTPNGPAALTINLETNFGTGVDAWGGTGGY